MKYIRLYEENELRNLLGEPSPDKTTFKEMIQVMDQFFGPDFLRGKEGTMDKGSFIGDRDKELYDARHFLEGFFIGRDVEFFSNKIRFRGNLQSYNNLVKGKVISIITSIPVVSPDKPWFASMPWYGMSFELKNLADQKYKKIAKEYTLAPEDPIKFKGGLATFKSFISSKRFDL